ncbi:MAG: YadA-like family protein [Lonepinella koalarum]|nr:YadA-like family protein [Lonepinella koalarum]
MGKDSFASGTGSQAVGNNAIATGGNIKPEQFAAELANFRDLLNQIEGLRTQIAEQEKKGTANQQLQDTLNSQIAQYETILERVREKQAQQATLNGQKTAKQAELDQENTRLTQLENSFGSNAFLPNGNKESYRNFLNIINALDWNKLNTPTGIADLTADLKNGVERDFGALNISDDKYRELIEGYRNAQGNITFLKPIFTQKINNDFSRLKTETDRIYLQHDSLRSSGSNNINQIEYSLRQDIYIKNSKPYTAEAIADFYLYNKPLEIEEEYPIKAPEFPRNSLPFSKEREDYNKASLAWSKAKEEFRKQRGYLEKDKYSQIQSNIHSFVINNLYSDTNGAFYKATQHYKGDIYDYIRSRYGTAGNQERYLNLQFIYPPVSRQLLGEEFVNPVDLKNIINFTKDVERAVTIEQLVYMEKVVEGFKKYNSLIDYNNNDAWIFDKNEFKSYMDTKVLPFMGKIEELATNLRALESSSLSEDERNAKAAQVIELRKYLAEFDYYGSKKDEKYYIHQFEPTTWNIDIKGEINRAIELWKQYEREAQATLLPYNNESLALQEIRKAIDAKSAEINTQKETIKTKQNEIADLENQINALALTGEEQTAEGVKNDLTAKLEEARAKLAEIQQDLDNKRNSLLGLDNQLATSPLGSKGNNAVAEGTNAFASGESAVAIGANSQAIGDSSVAIGKGAKALKDKALALGENAVANGVSAIAIGDNAGVSGEKAVGIGSGSTVSGDGAVSIGADNVVAHKNAVAIGSNITQTAENSVNLGHKSAATVERTAETAGTTKYEYSELLGDVYKFAAAQAVGVVTVGAKGEERRIQNVAAGLVSETSTDAINGSQLYAVAKAVDNGKLGIVKYHPTSPTGGIVGVANHLGGNEVNFSNALGEARRLTGVAEGVAPTDAVNKAQLDREIGAVHGRIDKVEKDVKKIKGSVSNAVAMASLPQVALPGQRQISVGTGHTQGTTAVAVGFSGLSDNGRVSYKLNTSVSQKSDFAVGAGLGFAW